MLEVPADLNRNARSVQEMGHPADTGATLIDYMCKRIGIDSLASYDLLDLRCGVRFTQAFLDRNVPIGTYTGIDVNQKVIDFLKNNVDDERLTYHHMDIRNQLYNPRGTAMEPNGPASLGDCQFDIGSMFSVITDQNPDEAADIFRFVRRYIRDDGNLFFSAFVHEGSENFKELNPAKPGIKCSYSNGYMAELLQSTGWSIVSLADPLPDDVPIMWSYLCVPETRSSADL